MANEQKYEVQVLDWNQFMPVDKQRWICASICDTFEQAQARLEVIQNAYFGVRIAISK